MKPILPTSMEDRIDQIAPRRRSRPKHRRIPELRPKALQPLMMLRNPTVSQKQKVQTPNRPQSHLGITRVRRVSRVLRRLRDQARVVAPAVLRVDVAGGLAAGLLARRRVSVHGDGMGKSRDARGVTV